LIRIDAIILAGGDMLPDDPLIKECPSGRRSLVNIQGKPMVQWVLDAISNSEAVDEIVIVGLSPDSGIQSAKPLHFLSDEGGIFENIRCGVEFGAQLHPERSKFITASADIPGITPEMVDWLAGQVEDDPTPLLYYTVIPQSVMEKRFPSAGRSYVKFSDITVCGGDINAIDKEIFSRERTIWQRLVRTRKKPLRQAALFGIDTLILVALHRISLGKTVRKVSRKLGLKGKALVSPYAEIGMDADKPYQLELLREALGNSR
jgi:GTP:adenosylcobinamide-phosphate guanylyltransferase